MINQNFKIKTTDSSNTFVIVPDGNIGIGTDDPQYALDIQRNFGNAGKLLRLGPEDLLSFPNLLA